MRKLAMAVTFAFGLAGWAAPANAAVQLHGLFTEGMVLQQGTKVPVWGSAAEGEKVTVTLQGQTVTATAKNGRWRVALDDLKPGGPFKMTVAGSNEIVFNDVLVGEVWVCSGQSNMEWPLRATRDSAKAIGGSADPQLRLFQVPKTRSQTPLTELGTGPGNARWVPCGPESVTNFTAVGYYFGRDLRKALKVPVGLIQAAWGGTAYEEWTSKEVLEKELKIPAGGNFTTLYNGMIKPLQPFAVQGVIWYQGESNAFQMERAERYFDGFSAMIRNWRDDWKRADLPFLFVQLAPFNGPKEPIWPVLREAQLRVSQKVPHTGMAVITDYGHPTDIHPQDKEPVGARLALLALKTAYPKQAPGRDFAYSGPVYAGMTVEGNKARLKFDHAGGGLTAKGDKLQGFTVAGEDGKFVEAEAVIDGATVVVSSPAGGRPAAVRFGWANHPVVNLFNREGLPATPFRTDGPK